MRPLVPLLVLLPGLVLGLVLNAAQQVARADDAVDFTRDIRPILSENCVFCHGPDEQTREAGLRIDTHDGAMDVITAFDSGQSELYLRLIAEPSERMPPVDSHRQLSEQQIAKIRQWIDQGAVWQQHWSFQPLRSPPIPAPTSSSSLSPDQPWPRNHPIDALVQARLAERGLSPAPEADRPTLIRRLSLDLTGLPPTPAEVDAFLADRDPGAYERVVDRLLMSPAFGQRMAWPWLDAARYADTNGYQGDRERTMWPWRDWVVEAFNQNMPFDRFTRQQIAGDLLPGASPRRVLATAFLRNHMINGEGGRIAEENRVEYVMDMAETVGTVWLGLTLNCCRCHDHKYDPVTNEEYYQFFAFFNQTPVDGSGGNPQTAPILAVPTDAQRRQLNTLQQQIADLAARPNEQSEQSEQEEQDEAANAAQKRREQLQTQLEALQKAVPKVMVMADRPKPRETFVLQRGLYNKPTTAVSAGVPDALPGRLPREPATRKDLADWLVADSNPLTARVTVNRLWQQVFGMGLVKTPEDFGTQGEIPEHLDLLNWLAADFRDSGWDIKHTLRTILTSHTYRQSSRVTDPVLLHQDPQNRLLARAARYRLPSWMIRDQALAAAGLLSPAAGGPAINTYQPEGVWEEASFGKKVYQRDEGEKLYRRSLYVFWRRIVGPTMFFDSASRQTCTVAPSRTNTPLHALQTLNSTIYVEAARHLAQLALQPSDQDDSQRIDFVFRRVLARPAKPPEQEILLAGLQRTRQQYQGDEQAAADLVSLGESPRDDRLPVIEHAAWTQLVLAVLNLDETLNHE